MIIIFALLIFSIVLILIGIIYIDSISITLRRKEDCFEYVYIQNDGSVRELDYDEVEYLNTEFSPANGNRPYIKLSYKSLTTD
jgi:hypothetical protein